MQITRCLSGAASGVLHKQHRHSAVVPPSLSPGWLVCRTAEQAACGSPAPAVHRQHLRASRTAVVAAAAAGEPGSSAAAAADADAEVGIHEVEELRGIRANLDSQDPVVEYRVHWKDGSPDTWELASNLSPDLVRDFDERWWAAAKKGDAEALTSMLQYGRQILSQVVDENRRSALHFVAAIGNAKCVKLLIDAGADINLQDKEGYTPLHMASGYMHTGPMAALLEAGADPLIKDKQGRDVVSLVENLRKSLPPNLGVLQRIMALEQVAAELTDRLYEEVEPARILDERAAAAGSGKEYLVQYQDDTPDEWLPDSLVAPDLVEDWSAGLERAPVTGLLDVQQWGTSREYLVQWADGRPDSWEDEAHIPQELVDQLRAAQPELFKGLKMSNKKRAGKKPGAKKKKKTAAAAAAAGAAADSSSNSSGSGTSHHAAGAAAAANGSSSSVVAASSTSSSRETVAV